MTVSVKQNLWSQNQDNQNWDQQQRKMTYGEELRAQMRDREGLKK